MTTPDDNLDDNPLDNAIWQPRWRPPDDNLDDNLDDNPHWTDGLIQAPGLFGDGSFIVACAFCEEWVPDLSNH
jgi:hypothetical protein